MYGCSEWYAASNAVTIDQLALRTATGLPLQLKSINAQFRPVLRSRKQVNGNGHLRRLSQFQLCGAQAKASFMFYSEAVYLSLVGRFRGVNIKR